MARTRKVRARRVRAVAPAAIEVTAEQVEQLFRRAWPKATQYPDLTACYSVAVAINVVRVAQSAAKFAEPKITTALKHARLLLRHLPALQHSWEAEQYNSEQLASVFPSLKAYRDYCATVLDAIKQADQCVRDIVERSKLVRATAPNPATYIAEKARAAWSSVPGLSVARSKTPDSPLCGFVRDALASAGKDFVLETVSDMLRERHRRPRPRKSRKTVR